MNAQYDDWISTLGFMLEKRVCAFPHQVVVLTEIIEFLDEIKLEDAGIKSPVIPLKEIERDAKLAKVIVDKREIEEDTKITRMKRDLWTRGYDKGYEAGRNGELKRIEELINRYLHDRKHD